MPLYDYRCSKCSNVDEHFKKYTNATDNEVCSKCGGSSSRQLSAPAISYQGAKTTAQRVPDSFKDILRNIRDKAPGGKEMRSSAI